MKKIFVLLIAFAAFTTGFAQSKKIEEAKRVINGQPQDGKVYDENGNRYPETYPSKNKKVTTNKKYKKNKNYKTNNGKHLGWEKGVGNPHRTAGKYKAKGKAKKS